ncbi:hypothetical protein PoB_003237800 [Plakobranchus ocellatus]|uniref:Uncharacterized protein n=1 Tax=Plakobranchus ocellatus TaxID=259542 RepID=A0AAV4AF27_9GAST|nr:hypothetical protein PoB_003237800 [Plakobranchus ocellatus]
MLHLHIGPVWRDLKRTVDAACNKRNFYPHEPHVTLCSQTKLQRFISVPSSPLSSSRRQIEPLLCISQLKLFFLKNGTIFESSYCSTLGFPLCCYFQSRGAADVVDAADDTDGVGDEGADRNPEPSPAMFSSTPIVSAPPPPVALPRSHNFPAL